jgi:site-specific DNA-methyltransferase (adenine-specific)
LVELDDFAAVKTENATVFHASNLDVLPLMADNSVDSIVCDPPYELGFMGKSWDSSGIAYSIELWRECLRVLKPGGHLLAFGGSRTWHRLAVAIEDAGFEVRDSIAWLYGSGFPKSLDIAKSIEAKLTTGSANKNSFRLLNGTTENRRDAGGVSEKHSENDRPADYTQTAEGDYLRTLEPTTDEAKQWQGWGTALKPAFEPVVVARKPLVGTVAANVLQWGVGGLNIDASRIGTGTGETKTVEYPDIRGGNYGQDAESYDQRATVTREVKDQGRWPANIILDDYTAELLDEQSGQSISKASNRGDINIGHMGGYGDSRADVIAGTSTIRGHNDSGGASRFFYVAKASKRDRNEGLEGLESKVIEIGDERPSGNSWERRGKGQDTPRQNFHPTVKPTDLMRYLIKLVTPAGGVVLDPFTGSGSTGKAALLDGYKFLGIELTADYLPIIEGRLKWAEAEAQREKQAAAEKENEVLF